MSILNKTLKNSSYAMIAYILLALLSILTRRVFVYYFPVDYLGYENLFSNIFSLLSILDLGVETLIFYRLMTAFSKKDHAESNELLSIYSFLYRIVGILILFLGFLLIPILPLIIKNFNNDDKNLLIIIYCIQLLAVVITYFFTYARIVFVASQDEYLCTIVEVIVSILFNTLKIAVIILLHNFIVFFLINVIQNVFSVFIIFLIAKRKYSELFVRKNIITFNHVFKKKNFLGDISNFFIQKISGVIYGSTDSLIITAFLGLELTGLFSNYILISGFISLGLEKILTPFQAAISKIVNEKENNDADSIFFSFDLIAFILASIISTFYYLFFNKMISLFFGEKFVIYGSFVLFFSINQYIMWNHKFLTYYRYSFGNYQTDKYYILGGCILNVILSVLLQYKLGIAGIMLGTCVGHLGFWIGRTIVVFKEYLHHGLLKYLYYQIRNTVILLLEFIVIYEISLHVENNMAIIFKFISFSIIIIINMCLVVFSKQGKEFTSYIKKVYRR